MDKGHATNSDQTIETKGSKLGVWIGLGLLLSVVCGLLFGNYCGHLRVLGQAYVGLLQMTVLPYLLLSPISKMGRLDPAQANSLVLTPEKEPVLDFLDVCSSGISRVSLFLMRIAPLGLFAFTVAAAGTMHFKEVSRLQAYLLILLLPAWYLPSQLCRCW